MKYFFSAAVAIFLLTVGAVGWFSPYWTLKNVQAAWATGQSSLLHDYIDYPELRINLKERIRLRVVEQTPGPSILKEQAGRTLGTIANPLVDRWVTEQQVDRWFAQGRPIPAAPKTENRAPNDTQSVKLNWELQRKGWSRVVLVIEEDTEEPRRLDFIMERNGLTSWVLVDIDFKHVLDRWITRRR